MKRDGTIFDRPDPDGRRGLAPRRNGAKGPTKQRGFVERATARGHSGHGAESVRPHLRDQLQLKALLPHPFPTANEIERERPGKDEHHQ
jgi:hypothetical protein